MRLDFFNMGEVFGDGWFSSGDFLGEIDKCQGIVPGEFGDIWGEGSVDGVRAVPEGGDDGDGFWVWGIANGCAAGEASYAVHEDVLDESVAQVIDVCAAEIGADEVRVERFEKRIGEVDE